MKPTNTRRWLRLVVPGAFVLAFSGCLGPNPLFFISTSAANATISRVVNDFLNGLLGAG